jgi:hypothetical protein
MRRPTGTTSSTASCASWSRPSIPTSGCRQCTAPRRPLQG